MFAVGPVVPKSCTALSFDVEHSFLFASRPFCRQHVSICNRVLFSCFACAVHQADVGDATQSQPHRCYQRGTEFHSKTHHWHNSLLPSRCIVANTQRAVKEAIHFLLHMASSRKFRLVCNLAVDEQVVQRMWSNRRLSPKSMEEFSL